MIDLVIILILLILVGLAVRRIYKNKKNGVQCLGCPNASSCSRHCCSEESPKH